MRSRGKAMPLCLCVCLCVRPQKNIEKCFKQGRKGIYRLHSQRKTISMIILGRFCTWYKSRRFFTPLFQLLPIIGFVAPPLSKSHVVVTVSNYATRTPISENTGGIDQATYGEARGVSIPWIHSSSTTNALGASLVPMPNQSGNEARLEVGVRYSLPPTSCEREKLV